MLKRKAEYFTDAIAPVQDEQCNSVATGFYSCLSA
jgi:hypothetical protein